MISLFLYVSASTERPTMFSDEYLYVNGPYLNHVIQTTFFDGFIHNISSLDFIATNKCVSLYRQFWRDSWLSLDSSIYCPLLIGSCNFLLSTKLTICDAFHLEIWKSFRTFLSELLHLDPSQSSHAPSSLLHACVVAPRRKNFHKLVHTNFGQVCS